MYFLIIIPFLFPDFPFAVTTFLSAFLVFIKSLVFCSCSNNLESSLIS